MTSPTDDSPDVTTRIAALHVYPIKSCAGVATPESMLIETGLEFDRTWMATDPDGRQVTQRELPRMALIQPTLKATEMVLRAPGMLALHIAFDRVEQPAQVTLFDTPVAAYDMGDLCAQWFSDFLGRPLRLVRFDPQHKRLSDHRWCGTIDAENTFTDGFPILVASTASMDEFNRRLEARGDAAVTLARFRPNIVLDGLDPHGEDALDEIVFTTDDGPVRLKLVSPCTRCTMPDIDPATAEAGHAVGDVLASYRADARVDGSLTFGMNAVLLEGIEHVLRVGQSGRATLRFD